MALRLQPSSSGGSERPNNAEQDKVAAFSVVRKKTPFQKHREEEEAKKKRADEEAARLYEEFVESFKADDVPGTKAFVRGGVMNSNDRPKATAPEKEKEKERSSSENTPAKEASARKPGNRYVPSFIPPGLAAIVNKDKESDKKDEEKAKERDRGKARNIDNFMEELKKEQEMREKRHQEREHRQRDSKPRGNPTPASRFDELPEDLDPSGKLPGSFDDGDPLTTNLYVGNLSPQVDENFLLRTFGRFGPVASVKIMWPRTEEERRRQRNCGFVAFMNRSEAQAAKDEMQGVVVYEYELRIGWGKAVALPAQALPAPPPGQMAIRSKEGGSKADVAWSGPGAPVAPSAQNTEVVLTPNVPDIEVVPPSDAHRRHVIDTMAMYVLDDGCPFEQAIMERGRGNPLFNFLFDLGSPEHTYYIWRLYSFAQGDTLQRWRTEPFIMVSGSGRWVPPPIPQPDTSKPPEHEKTSSSAAGKVKVEASEHALTDKQRDEFEDMLRALTLERSQIRDAMGFALDNAEASGEIVDVLTESLTLKETQIPTKVARLMLVSDILHNSSAPVKNASSYRNNFEARLPDVMESFNELYRNVTGRITAEALKERVLKVLQVWGDWFLFSDAYVTGLRATFLRPGNSGVPGFHALCGDAPAAGLDDEAEIDQAAVKEALAACEGELGAELMSLPFLEVERRCRHSGLSIRGGKQVMVSRLLHLEEAEIRNGRNEQLGKAEGVEMNRKIKPVLPESKWSREEVDEDDRNDARGGGVGNSSSDEHSEKRAEGEKRMDDEKRHQLRKLEVSLMEFRDSLEERGLRSADEIDRKLSQHRRKLEQDYGLESQGSGRSIAREDSSGRKRGRSRSRSRSPLRGKDWSRDRERESRDRDRRDRKNRRN